MSVIVVGSINMDTTYQVPHIPIPGETIISSDRATNRGGKGQNQAVTIARLEEKVQMIAAVGNDDAGQTVLEELKKDGVGTEYIYVKEEVTGLANIYVDTEKNNNIVVYPGANFKISKEDIYQAKSLFAEAKYCVMQMEVPLEVIYSTLEICKEYDVTTILNPAPANPLFDVKYLQYVDYLIPNESELEIITKEKLSEDNGNVQELAEELLELGCKNVIVTLGTNGSMLITKDTSKEVAALKVDAVDTTAAGDSYIGALTSYLSKGKSVYEAMEYGSIVSAQTVTKHGAINSIPHKIEVDQFINKKVKKINV